MSRKSGNRFSEKDMRQQRDLEHFPIPLNREMRWLARGHAFPGHAFMRQSPKERTDVGCERTRILQGREMAAGRHPRPTLDVAVERLGQRSWRREYLFGIFGVGGGHHDG